MKQRGIALILTLVVLAIMSAITITSAQHLRLQRLVESSEILLQYAQQFNQNRMDQVTSDITQAIEMQPDELPLQLQQALLSQNLRPVLRPSNVCLGANNVDSVSTPAVIESIRSVSWRSRVEIVGTQLDACEPGRVNVLTTNIGEQRCYLFSLIACTEQLAGRLVVSTAQQLTVSRWQSNCDDPLTCSSEDLTKPNYIQFELGNWQREVNYATSSIR